MFIPINGNKLTKARYLHIHIETVKEKMTWDGYQHIRGKAKSVSKIRERGKHKTRKSSFNDITLKLYSMVITVINFYYRMR